MTQDAVPYPTTQEIEAVFFPRTAERREYLRRTNGRLVHYTSAEAAMNIIKTKRVWMRSPSTMNDISETHHGLKCLSAAWGAEPGERFRAALEGVYPGIVAAVVEAFGKNFDAVASDTFVACLSEHSSDEDAHGRLSMWRAYSGANGVAIVLKNSPLFRNPPKPQSVGSPVSYLGAEAFADELSLLADGLNKSKSLLQRLGFEAVRNSAFSVLVFGALCVKHPAFREEREWRIIACPTLGFSPPEGPQVECVRGIPQIVHKARLENEPDNELSSIEIPDILDRIIIGPTQFGLALRNAFGKLLADSGVSDPQSKIFFSDVPLRH
jgi:hypothetical protein